jgi:hypothetical protein
MIALNVTSSRSIVSNAVFTLNRNILNYTVGNKLILLPHILPQDP